MENVVFQTEHLAKVALDKKKKAYKNVASFFNIIKQTEKQIETKDGNKSPKLFTKSNHADRFQPESNNNQDYIFAIQPKEVKVKNIKEKSKDKEKKDVIRLVDKETYIENNQHIKYNETNLNTKESKKTHKPNNLPYYGKVEMLENADQKVFNKHLTQIDKDIIENQNETKKIKEIQEAEIKPHQQFRERKESFTFDTRTNLEKDEINTRENKNLIIDKAGKNQDSLVYLDNKKVNFESDDKNYKNVAKQEVDRPTETKSKTISNISQENKISNRETQVDKIQTLNQTHTKNLKETTDSNKDLISISLERNIDTEIKSFSFRETNNLDIRQNSYHNQETTEVRIDSENPVEIVLSGREGFDSMGSYKGNEDFNFYHQSGSNQQSTLDEKFPQTKFNLSFNFMDTKINIHSNLTNILMHINTAQVVDYYTIEKIKQILTESGFNNHNIIIKDKTKTLKSYTNKTYLENRSNDGFKISA